MRHNEQIPWEEYTALADQFNPKDFDNKKNKNLCEGLERLSRRKELSLGQQIMYSCKSTKNRGSGLASVKSSFIFRFKRR